MSAPLDLDALERRFTTQRDIAEANWADPGIASLTFDEAFALLARLRAAEAVCERVQDWRSRNFQDRERNVKDFVRMALDAWRTAKEGA